jgi:hypothetical protein
MEATHLGTVPNLEVNPPAMNQIILFVATTHKHNRVECNDKKKIQLSTPVYHFSLSIHFQD